MAAFSEMQVRKRLIKRFIDQEPPLLITLLRPAIVVTDNGGTKEDGPPTPLSPQYFGIMPFKRRQTIEYVYDPPSMGRDQITNITMVLICTPDHNIEAQDRFVWAGEGLAHGEYVVEFIAIRTHDHKLAGIKFRG